MAGLSGDGPAFKSLKEKMMPDLDDLKRQVYGHTRYGDKGGWTPPLGDEREKRDRGMAAAAGSNASKLEMARAAALRVAQRDGTADADRVREELAGRGLTFEWGNWAGSIFKTGEWEQAGWTQAKLEGGHAWAIRVWRHRPL